MTLWKQGASAVPVLARLRIIFGSAGIGIGRACCPIGTALVSEFAPRRIRATMIVMGVMGVALPRMIRSRARTSAPSGDPKSEPPDVWRCYGASAASVAPVLAAAAEMFLGAWQHGIEGEYPVNLYL